jgi:hypothetical protein
MANLVFFAWTLGYFGEPTSGREPQRLTNQLRPELIRLLNDPQVAKTTPVVAPQTCKRLSGFTTALAAEALKIELQAALGEDGGWKITIPSLPTENEIWVGISGLATKAALEKKRGELIAAKFSELTFVEESKDGPFLILISKFENEATAKGFLEAQSKTLRTARVISRPRPADPVVEVVGPAKEFDQRTAALIAPLQLTINSCASGGEAR